MIRQAIYAFCLFSSMLMISCSGGDEQTTIDMTDEMRISIVTENFGEEDIASRSLSAVSLTDTVNLGDGLEAEVTLEEDAPSRNKQYSRSRAVLSDGRYTIHACDASGNLLTGTNKQITGTVTGGVFVKDASSKLWLDPGTYTFVCYNDKVKKDDVSGHLKVVYDNFFAGSATLENALIGTVQATVGGGGLELNFVMKHCTSRMRLRFVGYSETGSIAANLTLAAGISENPIGSLYSMDGTYQSSLYSSVSPLSPLSIDNISISTTSTTYNSKYVLAHDFTSNYVHVIADTEMNSSCSFDLSGTFNGINLSGKKVELNKLVPPGTKFVRNKSYTVTVKLKPKALYLFEDGSNGVLAEKGSRTPIGVVAREKTNTLKGIAVAMKDAGYEGYINMATQWETTWVSQCNTTIYTDMSDVFNDMNGYKWTWESAGTVDGRVKARDYDAYAAYYVAGNYSPGVTVTGKNIGNWYLPAIGEWAVAWKTLAGVTLPTYAPGTSAAIITWDLATFEAPFIAGGGTGLQENSNYWSSSEFSPPFSANIIPLETELSIYPLSKDMMFCYIRPFVQF